MFTLFLPCQALEMQFKSVRVLSDCAGSLNSFLKDASVGIVVCLCAEVIGVELKERWSFFSDSVVYCQLSV